MGRGKKKGKPKSSENLMDPIKSNPKAEEAAAVLLEEEKAVAEEAKKAILSLSQAAAKIDHLDLADFLRQTLDDHWPIPAKQIVRLVDYYGTKLSQVSFRWVKMFKWTPLSDLIKVPLSKIPQPVYETSVSFIDKLPLKTQRAFVLWASELILTEWPGVIKIEQRNGDKPKVAVFVALAMVLRSKPDALAVVLPVMREQATYQGEDKLPVIIWMMAQASQGDLSVGLYSWARNLLPLVGNISPQAMDLILRFVEMILSNPEARTILVNEAVREGERLVPPSSFKILMQHTFPASSPRIEVTKRFEAIYPLLKEVALAPDSATGSATMKQIFTFSLRLAGEGNPVLAKEATAIAHRCVTENVDCFKHWDILYTEKIEASLALLRKLVDEWKDHSLILSYSLSDALAVKHTIYSFMMKNENAIAEGVFNCGFLYKEADKSCKLILGRLSRRSGGLKITPFTAMVIAAAAAASGCVLVQAPLLLYPTT